VLFRLTVYLPLAITLVLNAACSKQAFTVTDAWIPVPPPHVSAVAGYMTLINSTDREHVVDSVVGELFERIEIHQTILDSDTGLARMVRQNEIVVQPGTQLAFAPGGYHLMLINPTKSLREGDTAQLRFGFSDGTTLMVTFEVKPRPALRP
jgi:copper(I)-binding protein